MLGGVERRRQARTTPTRGSSRAQPRNARGTAGAGALAFWSISGFAVVAVFWIALGVFLPAGGVRPVLPAVLDALGVDAPGCTALTLDRSLGHTIAEPCRDTAGLRQAVASAPTELAGGP